MWSLQNLLFTLCIALRCVTAAAEVIPVTGYVGREVRVSCSYDEGYESYEKYLCKNNCKYDDDVLITTQQRKNKYSIHDDTTSRIFTATISHLQSTDAGKYWCGVTRTGKDIFTEVELKLVQDSCCNTVNKIQSYEGYPESIRCPYDSQYQNNLKYICRGKQPSTCLQQALITSNNIQKGRFSLNEDKVLRTFTVTITSLRQQDSGPYLCGVQRNSDLDVFSAVELEVKEWCCVQSKTMRGTAGHSLTLQCPYPSQHQDNRKFLCKGGDRKSCKDVMTQSRFTLKDNVSFSYFSVTIAELIATDAGTYWCGSDTQWRVGDYVKFQLSVTSLQHTSPVPSSTATTTVETLGTSSAHIPDAMLYVLYTVPPVLLLICALVVIVVKCKRNKVKEAEVAMNRNTAKPDSSEEVRAAAENEIYGNEEVVVYTKNLTSKQQRACNHHGDAGGDEADYEDVITAEDIYCNENFHKAYRR